MKVNAMKFAMLLTVLICYSCSVGTIDASAKSKTDKVDKEGKHSKSKSQSSKENKGASQTSAASTTTPAGCAIDEKSNGILKNVSSFYLGLKSLETRLIQTMEVSSGTKKIDLSTVVDVVVKRPDMLSIKLRAGLPGGSLFSSDGDAYYYSQILNEYAVVKAPSDYEKLFSDPNSKIVNGPYALYSLLPSLLSTNPYQSILAGVKTVEYVGIEMIDDTQCHHITFSQDQFAWDLWIGTGKEPWVVKVSPALFPETLENISRPIFKTTGAKAKMALLFRYKNSIANPHLKNSAFAFDPPPESKKTASLAPEPTATAAEPVKLQLIGKPAPPLKLTTLDGGSFDLAAHKGKSVVVLDFWASWCPDCRATLPAVRETMKKYEDKNVVFCAVDLAEAPETVKAYLKKSGLDMEVALDADKKAAELYGVKNIPHTVIIDKDGIVQSATSDMNDNLGKRLDRLFPSGASTQPAQ